MAVRRLNRVEAAWAIGALSADYLMLFNPRTETCSYVFLGPFVASLALFYAPIPGRKWLSYALGIGALGLACDAIPVVHGYTRSLAQAAHRPALFAGLDSLHS